MSFELAMLAASCVLCLIQIVISSHAASLQRGYRWTTSSRDAEVPPLTGLAGRLERALRNFLETFPVFVAAVFFVHALGRESALSEWGAGLYFRPGWFTCYSTQRPFLCSARSSGTSRSLELSFSCSRQLGPCVQPSNRAGIMAFSFVAHPSRASSKFKLTHYRPRTILCMLSSAVRPLEKADEQNRTLLLRIAPRGGDRRAGDCGRVSLHGVPTAYWLAF